MRFRGAKALFPAVAIATIAVTFGLAITAAHAEEPPTSTPTGAPVTVVIPGDPNATPAPTSSNGGSSNNGGSNNGGNGSTPGTTPPAVPKNADGSPIPPGKASAPTPGLSLDHETIEAKQFMIATGTGYTPGEKVQVVLYPGAVVIGSYTADASGAFEARFRIPEATAIGIHTIEATGWDSGRITNKEFTVTSPAIAAGIPVLWWVLVVLGVILLSLISAAIYFRFSLARMFSGRSLATGVVS